ncbi:hypothetical protein [Clostridium sp.]|uniref:hypothetical protein n=1 Tax=Clostridium sp. TaxID=1506 RepID=UPI003D6D9E87
MENRKRLKIFLCILIVIFFLYHFRELNINKLVNFSSISSSDSLKVVILKRNTFLGEIVKQKEITNRLECIKFIDDLKTYKLRRAFIKKGSDDVTQYFIGVKVNGNNIINLTVKGDNYIHVNRSIYTDYKILKTTYNTDLLEKLLN